MLRDVLLYLFLYTIVLHCWAFEVEVEEYEIGVASLLQVELRLKGSAQAEEVLALHRSNVSFGEKPALLPMGVPSLESSLSENVDAVTRHRQVCDSSYLASVWPIAWLAIGSVACFCILFRFGRKHADNLCDADRPQRDHFSDHVKFVMIGVVVFLHICIYDILPHGFIKTAETI
jgi:hypothetical protein